MAIITFDLPVLLHFPSYLRTVSSSQILSVRCQFRYVAEFGDAIRAAIPALIELLKDGHYDVRSAGASALGKLSKNSEFKPDIVSTLLIQIRSRVWRCNYSSAH